MCLHMRQLSISASIIRDGDAVDGHSRAWGAIPAEVRVSPVSWGALNLPLMEFAQFSSSQAGIWWWLAGSEVLETSIVVVWMRQGMEELQVSGVEARRQRMHSEISEKALSGLMCICGGHG